MTSWSAFGSSLVVAVAPASEDVVPPSVTPDDAPPAVADEAPPPAVTEQAPPSVPVEPPAVMASVNALEVVLRSCDAIEAPELARLIELELADVTTALPHASPLRVEITCTTHDTALAIVDPITDKRVARTIPAPPPGPGGARVLALATAQLFAASWLELLTVRPAKDPSGADAPPPVAPPAIRDASAAAAAVARERIRIPPRVEIMVGLTGGGRHLEASPRMPSVGGELLVRGHFGAIGPVGALSWTFARTENAYGRVHGHSVVASLGMAWRVPSRARMGRAKVTVGGHVLAGVGVGVLRGIADAPDVQTGQAIAATAEASAAVGPRWSVGRLRIDLDALVGGGLPTPRGQVEGVGSVNLGGLLLGLALRLGSTVP